MTTTNSDAAVIRFDTMKQAKRFAARWNALPYPAPMNDFEVVGARLTYRFPMTDGYADSALNIANEEECHIEASPY